MGKTSLFNKKKKREGKEKKEEKKSYCIWRIGFAGKGYRELG